MFEDLRGQTVHWIERGPELCVAVVPLQTWKQAALSPAEARSAPVSEHAARRWRAGRGLARAVLAEWGLRADVLRAANGAPQVVGATGVHLSLSHDAGWVAVAASRVGRVGLDLCVAERRTQALRVLAGLGVGAECPLGTWAALEATLKFHERSVTDLLSAGVGVTAVHGGLAVSGLGARATCRLVQRTGYALAWTLGPGVAAACTS